MVLGNGQLYKADKCPDENLKYLLQRLSQDIIIVMRDLEIDQVEYAFLKCILLFDPGKNGLFLDVIKNLQLNNCFCIRIKKFEKHEQSERNTRLDMCHAFEVLQ